MCFGETFTPARSGHTAVMLQFRIYVFGGFTGEECLDDLFVFDTEENEWKRLEPEGRVPAPRASHSACSDDCEYCFYVFGGSGIQFGKQNYNDLYSYYPRENTFYGLETSGQGPPASYGHSLSYYKNALYVFGGTEGFEYFKSLFRLDLVTKVWQKVPTNGAEPEPRYKHQAVPTDRGSLIILGGMNKVHRLRIFEFTFDKLEWKEVKAEKKTANLFRARFGHTCFFRNGSVYCYGGTDERIKGDLIRFNLKQGVWHKCRVYDEEKVPYARDFHTLCYARDQFFVIGGANGGEKLNDVYKFYFEE